MTSSLNTRDYLYVSNYNIAKEIWNTLEIIYGDFLEIKQEKMNMRIQKDETPSKS